MGEMNFKRAFWAESALEAFCGETGQKMLPLDPENDETLQAIGDLICDLLHLAAARGSNSVSTLHSNAFNMYVEEINDNE